MTLLRDDQSTAEDIRKKFTTILSALSNVESAKAKTFVEWMSKKANKYSQHLRGRYFNRDLPNNMKVGDIVLVDFGVNIGDELSDHEQKGHYALICDRHGYMLTVIPLTKTSTKSSINLGRIEGMPAPVDSHAKFDMIRSIHARRIRRIEGLTDGKIIFKDPDKLRLIAQKFRDTYVASLEQAAVAVEKELELEKM